MNGFSEGPASEAGRGDEPRAGLKFLKGRERKDTDIKKYHFCVIFAIEGDMRMANVYDFTYNSFTLLLYRQA